MLLLLFSSASNSGILYTLEFNGANGTIIDTDANTVLSSFQTTNTETGIAIHDTIRTINQDNSACCGNENDLNGVLVNSNISFNQIFSDLYDGTTDGQYNYAIDHNLQHGGNYSSLMKTGITL